MLVLRRRSGQEAVITVGDVKIRVIVLSMSGGEVRLGVEAPPEVMIERPDRTPHKSPPLAAQEEVEWPS